MIKILTCPFRCLFGKSCTNQTDVDFLMNDPYCLCTSNDKICESRYCSNKVLHKIIKKIDRAKKSIYISMYVLTNNDLITSILHAKNRGIDLRLIMDKSTFTTKRMDLHVSLRKTGKQIHQFP